MACIKTKNKNLDLFNFLLYTYILLTSRTDRLFRLSTVPIIIIVGSGCTNTSMFIITLHNAVNECNSGREVQ